MLGSRPTVQLFAYGYGRALPETTDEGKFGDKTAKGTDMLFKGLLTVTAMSTASAGLACTYEPNTTSNNEGRTVFLGDCGFYETGYRLEGNVLHFPNGGTHALTNASEQEAQAILRQTYGLVEAKDGALVRTKGVVRP